VDRPEGARGLAQEDRLGHRGDLSWEARNDAIAAGALAPAAPSVYETRGILRLGQKAPA
jgi:hypothetical protein